MARSLNRCHIIGNLGQNPETRYTPDGTAFTAFRVAVSAAGKSKDAAPQWFHVTCWGKQAELASEYLHVGSLVYVEGEVELATWSGQNGQLRASLDLRARSFEMLSSAQQQSAAHSGGDADGRPA